MAEDASRAPSATLEPTVVRVPRESARLIRVALAQLHSFLRQGHEATNQLATAVGSLASHVSQDDALDPHLATAAQDAVMAMQFYDHLSQRLNHVTAGLELLAGLLEQPERYEQPEAWPALHETMKGLYSLADEKALLIELLDGVPPPPDDDSDNDVEFF